MGEQVIVWPMPKVELLLKALDFCMQKLKPMAKEPEIKTRLDQYAFIKDLVVKAKAASTDGSISVTINDEAAALIKPAVVSYVAELQKGG